MFFSFLLHFPGVLHNCPSYCGVYLDLFYHSRSLVQKEKKIVVTGLNLPISSYNHIEIGRDVICSMNNFAVTIQTNGQIDKPSYRIKDHEMGFNLHLRRP